MKYNSNQHIWKHIQLTKYMIKWNSISRLGPRHFKKTIVVLKPSPNMFQRLLLVNLATYFKHLDLLDALYGKIVATKTLLFYQIWVQVWHAHDFCTELLRLLNLEGVMNIFLANGTLKNIQLMNPNILNTLHYHFVIMTFKKTF